MSVGSCTILVMQTYQKYTWVCTGDCDALIEYTFKDGFGWPNGVMQLTCPCGSNCTLVSEEDATIPPMNERKEMETTTPINYDANVLVTYKDIIDGVATYPTIKVNDLEYRLDRIKRLESQLSMANSQLGKIIDNLTAQGWYNPNTEKSDVLEELCEILGHEPKQDITIKATITVDVTYACPLEEVEDFDARYFLQDTLSVDAYNGDVIVDSFDVEDADVEW